MKNTTLKVMTFNVRVDVAHDGINSFTNRFDRVMDTVNKEKPDVVGFQEVTEKMRHRIAENLSGYTFQGCGREADYHGETMLVAYKTADTELISLDNIWLSPTPHVPGSTFGGDQSPCPRMLTTLLLKHRNVSEPFRFINTHLDHSGKNARYLGAMEILQLISGYKENFILTGDFNAFPDSPEIKLITSVLGKRGAVDCTEELEGTFHDFGRLSGDEKQKIDYIFTDFSCQKAYIVEDAPIDGQYYSDHYAVCAILKP